MTSLRLTDRTTHQLSNANGGRLSDTVNIEDDQTDGLQTAVTDSMKADRYTDRHKVRA